MNRLLTQPAELLYDHLIVSRRGYVSLKERGLI